MKALGEAGWARLWASLSCSSVSFTIAIEAESGEASTSSKRTLTLTLDGGFGTNQTLEGFLLWVSQHSCLQRAFNRSIHQLAAREEPFLRS